MKYALLSDIHANLPALDAVLLHIDGRRDLDGIFHLGDLVGYAPWPNETVSRLTERGIPGVAGNYDSTVATDYKHCGCKYEDPRQAELAHVSYEWTRQQVSAETKGVLGALPFRLDLRTSGGHLPGRTIILVHGTPTLNTVYWTADRTDDFCLQMAEHAGAKAGDLIAFGHTHLPWHREVGGVHFLNAGSVGRPKDGDWRAGYVVVDVDDQGVGIELVRVEYELERTTSAIRQSDLPDEFATYLEVGGAVSPPSVRTR
jgi:putative phosphoesterase